jgi:pimeloyl-ACP methyl ester carboxylesterase
MDQCLQPSRTVEPPAFTVLWRHLPGRDRLIEHGRKLGLMPQLNLSVWFRTMAARRDAVCPKQRRGSSVPNSAVGKMLALLFVAQLFLIAGCGGPRYLSVREVPRNPLAGPLNLLSRKGPRPTERTLQTLRRYDFDKLQQEDPAGVLAGLQQEIMAEPTAEKIHAYSELAYIEAFKADTLGDDTHALDLYCSSVYYAYEYLFDPEFDRFRNPYDPQFRRACDLYNASLEAALRIVKTNGNLLPGKVLTFDVGAQQIHIDVVAGHPRRPEEFADLEFVSDFQIAGLKNHHHSYGLGVPLIAIRRRGEPQQDPAERYYPKVLTFPTTAFLRIQDAQHGAQPQGVRHCVLELYDPMEAQTIMVANRHVPLETDLSTPLGYALEKGRDKTAAQLATWGLLDPDSAAEVEGLYMVETYDPRKIPVLMIHGLWSSPLTWMEMFNDLLAYPEIREHYQFWFYLYPTGEPFWFAANRLRNDLVEIRQQLDPYRQNARFDQMVLVGHSMGGLVATMQTLDSGNDFWEILSERPFDELQADPEIRQEIAQTVFFEPNSSVRQVVTIGTPHRGSNFANEYTRFLAQKLIRLPARVMWVTQNLVLENPGFLRDTNLLTISTSIDSLAPDSPVLPTMLEAQRAPWVGYHNIVGVIEDDSWLSYFSEEGDGVVSFDSAHRADFASEIVVNADHVSVHAHPRAVLEVRRILLEHLSQLQQPNPNTIRWANGNASGPSATANW